MKIKIISPLLKLLIPVLLFSSCQEDYTPKPRGFFRIDFPEKKYSLYDSSACPFVFEYPVYANVTSDNDANTEPCFLNIEYPAFKGKLHISYKPVQKNLEKYTEESRSLAYKHSVKAEAINEKPILNKNNVYGLYYDIAGNTASSIQFYVTDSTRHFLRGSLYFYIIPKNDSMAPVIDFIRKDISYLINSFKWKD